MRTDPDLTASATQSKTGVEPLTDCDFYREDNGTKIEADTGNQRLHVITSTTGRLVAGNKQQVSAILVPILVQGVKKIKKIEKKVHRYRSCAAAPAAPAGAGGGGGAVLTRH